MHHSWTEILSELQSSNPSSPVSKSTVFQWVKHFQSGKCLSIFDNRARWKIKFIEHISAMIVEDIHNFFQKKASTLSISSGCASSILHNKFGYHKVCIRWIPYILTPRQKSHRVAYSTMLPRCFLTVTRSITMKPGYNLFEPLRKAMNRAQVKVGCAPYQTTQVKKEHH